MVARNHLVASAVLMVLAFICGCTVFKSAVNENRRAKAISRVGDYERVPPAGYVPIFAQVVRNSSPVDFDSVYFDAAEAVALREVAKLAPNTNFIETPPPFDVKEIEKNKPLADQANSDYVLGVTVDRLTLTRGSEKFDLTKKDELTHEDQQQNIVKNVWKFATSIDTLETKITITLMQRDTENGRWRTLVSGIGTAKYVGAVNLNYEDSSHQGSVVGKTASKLEQF